MPLCSAAAALLPSSPKESQWASSPTPLVLTGKASQESSLYTLCRTQSKMLIITIAIALEDN